MTHKQPSRSAAKRLTQQFIETSAATVPLAPSLVQMLDLYVPIGVDDAVWDVIKPVHCEVMSRSGIRGDDSFRKHLGVVAKYLMWRHSQAMPFAVFDAFKATEIDRYYLHGIGGTERTRNDYRSRLLNIAKRVNPGVDAPIDVPALGHQSVRPGYSTVEESTIRRVALRQRNPHTKRQLCAIVGLCAGAGLTPGDIRHLQRCHVVDQGENGIQINITGATPRMVWVRREYEQLVRVGIAGLSAKQLVIGEVPDRRNVTTGVISGAERYDAPPIDASRLRSTWLTWLLCRAVPVQVILQASGLKGARTLTELVGYMPAVETDTRTVLQGEVLS